MLSAAEKLFQIGRSRSSEELTKIAIKEGSSSDFFGKFFEVAFGMQRYADALHAITRYSKCQDTSVFDFNFAVNSLNLISNTYRNYRDYPEPGEGDFRKNIGAEADDFLIGVFDAFDDNIEAMGYLNEACAHLIRNGFRIKLVLIGDERSGIESRSSVNIQPRLTEEISWIIRVDHVPFDKIGDYYRLLDAVVVSHKPSADKKLLPLMRAAEAQIYGKRLLVSNVFPLSGIATSFDASDLASIIRAIQDTMQLPPPESTANLLSSIVMEPETWSLQVKGNVSAHSLNSASQMKGGPKWSKAIFDTAVEIAQRKFVLNGISKQIVADDIRVPVPGAILKLSASVVYRLQREETSRKAVLLFDFWDKEGRKKATFPEIGVSAVWKQHFRYLNANSKSAMEPVREVFNVKLPEDVSRVAVSIGTVGVKDDEQIEVCIQGRCHGEVAEQCREERKEGISLHQPLPDAIIHDPHCKRLTSDLKVACVLDEFTAECLSHEVTLMKVTREGWQAELERTRPDFLLVESCWRGNDGNWGTLTKGSGGAKKLGGLLRYCKKSGIPTVFWNKEDPPHYEKFGAIAALFDLAITTDVNMVPRYKKDFGINVHPLSFGAQPKVHNPKPIIPRLKKAVFAGSYYRDKPKRCEDFDQVMGQLKSAGVSCDIFDRNFNKGNEKFSFPGRYQSSIMGNLPPDEVWRAHKGYKYQVNMNSVQDSATMFARRVYESLASGTPVISNDSLGVRELFGDVVIMSCERSIADQLQELEASPHAYQSLALRGVRAVMREHTYGHRIQTLCRLIGIDVAVALPKVTLAVSARCLEDIQRARRLFEAQTAQRKRLFIELENFDMAHQLLNDSNQTVTYSMKIARNFYADEKRYYGSDHVLKHDINQPLHAEALEDYLYWGPMEHGSYQLQVSEQIEVAL
ncbi:Glycosyl transferases group 1 [Paracoccus seriniphilus]|uniref:Glycosyl transferases group 1 n=1 Tax=Paracoccus seriniphilus TaxID=184748 RepID=A0A239Q2Q9_9RHOB|nr:Glycosyl transferases group 1 [Paracoccus seriniphilus]